MNATAAPQRPRILLVEDEDAMRTHLAELLSDEFEVETAANGEQALIAVLRTRPELVITDIVMPLLDGVELVRLLRETPSTSSIPVLLTSGRAPEELRIAGFEVGADSYLAKPYSGRELRARIRSLLQTGRKHEPAAGLETLELAAAERAALLESITDSFFALDEQDRVTYANQRALDFFARARADVLGKSLWALWPQLDDEGTGASGSHDLLRATIGRVRDGRRPLSLELPAGGHRWLELHAFPGASGLAVNFRDITERKRAETILRDSEVHFRAIADQMPVLMWRSDPQYRGIWFNKTWLDFRGRSMAEETGSGWASGVHPEDLPRLWSRFHEAIAQDQPFEVEVRLRRHDGEYRWMLDRGNPVHDGPGGTFSGYIGTFIDITDLKRSTEALLAAEQRYRAFVANSSEAIWRYELDEPLDLSWPPERQLEFILEHAHLAELNDAMARMYGFSNASEMVGAPLSATLPPDDPAARDYLLKVIEARFQLPDIESEEKDREGRTRFFSNSITPVVENGFLLRAWGTQRDITDRKLSERGMKEAERRKDEFVATLAHELRNPLAPIRNGIYLLKGGKSGADADRVLGMMDRQMTHMVRLLDDLLDLSRITRGRLELQRSIVRMSEVLAEAVESTSPVIESRRHLLDVRIEDPEIRVDGDRTRLAQILANLISNAAKYTEPGGRITVSLSSAADDCVVSVTDTGIGIPEHALGELFEMFSQVRVQQQMPESGLGIGLSVVRTLVHMHGGSVTAHSEGLGKGSTFTVRLPRVFREPAGESAPQGYPDSSPLRTGRILVVDDNREAAQTLAVMLKSEGHQVQAVYGGEEAVAEAARFQPDLIFMDLGMPKVDGYEATRRIRALDTRHRPAIIALTGWGQPRDRQRAREAGMDDHLVKPVAPELLREIVRRRTGESTRTGTRTGPGTTVA
jgi:PAS domain S-box-containing protein